MKIKSAKYIKNMDGDNNCIRIEEENREGHLLIVPLDPANTDYAEIMRQVDAGELTIEEAE